MSNVEERVDVRPYTFGLDFRPTKTEFLRQTGWTEEEYKENLAAFINGFKELAIPDKC